MQHATAPASVALERLEIPQQLPGSGIVENDATVGVTDSQDAPPRYVVNPRYATAVMSRDARLGASLLQPQFVHPFR